MRSVPGAPCLSASVSLHLMRGAVAMNACQDTNAIFSYLRPGLQAALIECGIECECCWVRGVTHIRFCPVGKITNGSEIAVPQSGSSLSNKCSHANQQSPHKPHGWCSPLLHLRSLINCPHTNMVCVALYILLMWPVIYFMLFCFLHTSRLGCKS